MTATEVNARVLLAVAAVILAARLFGWVFAWLGQPRVQGEMLSGIVLGPSLLGLVWADGVGYLFPTEVVAALRVLAQLGLVMFMFLVGLELDLAKLRGQGHRAVLISHASIVTPIALGVALGLWLHPRFGDGEGRLGFALFLGAAMAITAFPVLARVLQETGLSQTRIGVLVVTCAAVDDVTAWCLLAGVVALVQSTGPADTLLVVAESLAFLAAMLAVVRPALARLPTMPVWAALALALTSAWTTEVIGIHAIFGGFMAGAVMPRGEGVPRLVEEKLQTVTVSLLLPIFFVVVGLSTRIDLLNSPYLWGVTALVVMVAIAGKWGGSMIAARFTGESWRDAAAIGVLMNTRGLTELVILNVGYELGVIGETIFTVMVLMALITTFMATPLLALISDHRTTEPAPALPVRLTARGEPASDLPRT